MKLDFTEKQLNLIKEMGLDFDATSDLTDEQITEIEDSAVSHLVGFGMDEAGNYANDIGMLCESIIDITSTC